VKPLDEQVILVTGATDGLGRGVATALADAGATLLLHGRSPERLDAVVEEIGAATQNANLRPYRADLASLDEVRRLGDEVVARESRLDALVNNAGIGGSYSDNAAEFDLDEARATLETNLFGAWRLAQAALPLLRDSADARIVNVSSGAGQLDDMQGGYPAYRISKSGLNALTRILAAEEGNVRVNSLCPGWVRTDMGGGAAPRSLAEGADTAVWLATDPEVGSGGFFRDRQPIPW